MSTQQQLRDDTTGRRATLPVGRSAARTIGATQGAEAGRTPAGVAAIEAYRQPRRAPKRQARHAVARPLPGRRHRGPASGAPQPAGPGPDFDEVYARYFRQLCGYLQRILCDAHSAEDVCQQTFIRVWRALPRFREYSNGSLEGWLYTIAHRCALNEIKKRRQELTLDPAKLQVNEPFDMHAVTEHWIDNEEIERRFTKLPLLQQQVLTLRYLFDMSCAEAAETLGRTTTCVTSVEHRARRTLSRSATSVTGAAHSQRAHAA